MKILTALFTATIFSGACAAQPAATQSGSSTTTFLGDGSTDSILDKMNERGRDLRSLNAAVTLTETDAALGDASSRSGKFWLENLADGSARAHIIFDRKMVDGKASVEKIEYQLDHGKLVDRNYRAKKQVTREVLKPGEKMNLLKLGEGPFPLPIGQDPSAVHAAFDVKLIAATKDDPADTDHLQLTPKEGSNLSRKFKTIDVWPSRVDGMPARIETMDVNETNIRRTDLIDVKLNAPLTESDLSLEKIDDSSWDVTQEGF